MSNRRCEQREKNAIHIHIALLAKKGHRMRNMLIKYSAFKLIMVYLMLAISILVYIKM